MGCRELLAANSHLGIAVYIDGEFADVLDHGLKICVVDLREIQFGAVVQLDFLLSHHREQRGQPQSSANHRDGHADVHVFSLLAVASGLVDQDVWRLPSDRKG